jgi:hypothetical protein
MTDKIFNGVVKVLERTSRKTGLSYEQVNVYGMFAWVGITIILAYKVFKR